MPEYVSAIAAAIRSGMPENELDAGDTITVTWGEECYVPRPYMSFRVGPLSATTKIRPGETPDEYNRKRNQYLINLQEL